MQPRDPSRRLLEGIWGQTGLSPFFQPGDNGNNSSSIRSESFNYDTLNRIVNAQQTTGTQWGESYTIDAWGNMTAIGSYNGKPHESLSSTALPSNQLSGYGYDAAGNMTSNGTASYTYDAENRLIATAGNSYIYDGDGQRVEKCTEGSTPGTCATGATGTLYWRGLGSEPLTETNLAGALQNNYVFFNGQRVARSDSTPLIHYYFSDHLGSHGVVENATGTTCEQDIDYYPYGGVEEDYCSGGGVAQNYKFTGKERDAESGLDEFGARYYASPLGRFMTPDWAEKPIDVPYADFGNPQSLNLYSYVKNNPTTTRDPDGHCAEVISCTIEFGAGGSFFGPGGTIVGGIIGAAVGGAIVYYGGKAAINYFHSSDNSNAAPAPASGTQAGTQPKDVYIDPNKYPGSAGHAADAQAAGKPDVLTVDRPGKSDNRSDAMAGHPAQPGTDRDEYPPAVTREGGAGASVRNIDPSDNRGAGASLGNQIRDVPNGGQIRVIPQPPPPPPPKPEPQSN